MKPSAWSALRYTSPRLLLAFKASLAVGIAWVVAPLMPGVLDEYPYYAPLGALLSMHSTLVGSLKYGLQILAGLATGIGLAAAVLFIGPPNLVTIALVVAAGVLIGSIPWLGEPGKEYLPIAALFVLIVGGQDADAYSIGYLVQMTVGVAVGLGVNLAIAPPLAFDTAIETFSRFRTNLAKHLDDVGVALRESWPPEREDWASQNEVLAATAQEVRTAIQTADSSRKGNPRALRRHRNFDSDYSDLAALENVTFHIRDLTEVLAGAVWGKPFPVALPPELCPALSEGMHAAAEVLRAWNVGDGDTTALHEADEILNALLSRLDESRGSGTDALSAAANITMTLRRIVATVRIRVEPQGG